MVSTTEFTVECIDAPTVLANEYKSKGVRWPRKVTEWDYLVPDIAWPSGTEFVILPGSGRIVGEVLITPELARAILRHNADNQRSIKPGAVARYKDDMLAGLWRLTHQGIAFSAEAKLIDGQNRMQAVAECGMPQWFTVWLGSGGDNEMVVTDRGVRRNLADGARVVRLDLPRSAGKILNAALEHGSVNGFQKHRTKSDERKVMVMQTQQENLATVVHWFGTGKCPTVVKAAVLCALAGGRNRARLELFARAFMDQDLPPGTPVQVWVSRLGKWFKDHNNQTFTEHIKFLAACFAIYWHLSSKECPYKTVQVSSKAIAACPWPFEE